MTETTALAQESSWPANDGHEPHALVVDKVVSGYERTTVIRDVSFAVPKGSVVALLGPNGAGKTTLLKTISGLLESWEGSIAINGVDATKMRPHRRVKHGLCHIPEGRGIYRSLTVRDNLAMHSPPREERRAIELAVDAFPILGERLNQTAGSMSGGQQQMLAIVRAYIQNPTLILVDEASLGLAPIVVDEMFEFLSRLTMRGASLLVVDQFATRVLQIATTAHVMRRGELVFSGRSADLLASDVFEHYLGTDGEPA